MQNTDNNSKPKQMFIKEKGQENKAKKYLPADVPKENFVKQFKIFQVLTIQIFLAFT